MITQIQKDKLNLYADLKKEIKDLELRADELKEEVLDIMQMESLEEVSLATGKIILGSRRTWKYPQDVISWEEDLKAKKKEAEQLGTATYVENQYPIFKENKYD